MPALRQEVGGKVSKEQIAIDALNYFKVTLGNGVYSEFVGVFDIAIKAIEKQIPKKPISTDEQNMRYVTNYTCPYCGKHFSGTGIASYCYHCGQALDWSDNNV